MPTIQKLLARIFTLLVFSCTSYAQSQIVANVPNISGPNQPVQAEQIYLQIIEAIDKELPDTKIVTQLRPFARSLREVSQGGSDFHLPMLCVPNPEIEKYLEFSREKVGTVVFGIFSNKSKPIDRKLLDETPYQLTDAEISDHLTGFPAEEQQILSNITQRFYRKQALLDEVEKRFNRPLLPDEKIRIAQAAFPYHIETERFHINLLDYPTYPASNANATLHRMLSGRIDAIIQPLMAVESLIENEKLSSNISRALFKKYDVCYLVAKNDHGKVINEIIARGLQAIKENGQLDAILAEGDQFEATWEKRYAKPATDK